MYVSNAHKTRRSKPKEDSPATAGVGKMPAQTVTNKKELKELGERMGWKVRPLTEKEIRGEMSGQELIWHETFSPDKVEKALALADKNKQYDEAFEQWKVKAFWDGSTTSSPEERKLLKAEFQKFVDAYPQYRSPTHAHENLDALSRWLQDRHLYPIYSNLVLAFEACALAGKLWLNPSAISAGQESETYGTQHHNFHLLIQPQRRNADDGLSADEYFEKNRDVLADKRTPPLIAARQARVDATVAHFQQAAEHTSKANVVAVTDYPDDPSGYLTHSKYSFKKYVAGLSAKDFQEKLNDPTFLAALDRTSDGNK